MTEPAEPHPADVAEWMGLDREVEAVILATHEPH